MYQSAEGNLVSIYAVLDNESKSTQTRKDFIGKLKLKGKTKFASISSTKRKTNIISIKDSREIIITAEVKLQVVDNSNTLSFIVREANRKNQNQNAIATSATVISYKSTSVISLAKNGNIYMGDSCITLTQTELH